MKVNHTTKDWREIPFVAYALIIMNVLYFGLMFVAPMIWARGITSVQGLSGRWCCPIFNGFN
ncbi:hypothetical protein QY890_11515 [Latilactobacillus sakei]